MNQPTQHDRMHPMWPDRWDPYRQRDYVVHLIDPTITNRLWQANFCVELFTTGCLDAPEEIPLGATECMRTIGGFQREGYLRLGREWATWDQYLHASHGTAEMLKEILREVDNE